MSEVKTQIREFIKENFFTDTIENLTDEDSLLENGIIDSTGVLELVTFLEENFEIAVEDDELIPENLDSIVNISNYIQTKK